MHKHHSDEKVIVVLLALITVCLLYICILLTPHVSSGRCCKPSTQGPNGYTQTNFNPNGPDYQPGRMMQYSW